MGAQPVGARTRADLQERYGGPRRRSRVLVALLVVLAGAAGSWLLWTMLHHGRPAVQSELVTFEVVGPHESRATVTVLRRSPDVTAECLLRAQASDHSIVGELNFTVPAGEPTRTTLRKSVRTEREATAVSLVGCVSEEQQRPR